VTGPTLGQLAADLVVGRTTSRLLVEGCLAAIADPAGEGARTFLHVNADRALAAADASDQRRRDGFPASPLDGVPVSIKDLFDVEGEVTRAGSRILADNPPAERDADAVALLRAAGFVLIGRTNMTEFAFSGLGLNPHYGTPLNRWRREERRIPGGSTSGGAISVSDGMAHGALGTDTGGSCRIPAAFNGLVGFKPTARRSPRRGALPLSTTLDSVGTIARSVSCCAALDSILSGARLSRGSVPAVRGLRFATLGRYVMDGVEDVVADRFDLALAALAKAGASIQSIELPELDIIPLILSKGGFAAAESYAWHRRLIADQGALYDPRVRTRIMRGGEQSAADYIDLIEPRRLFIAAVERRLAWFDALLMPTAPITPPSVETLLDDAEYGRVNLLALRNPTLVNLFDGCAISIPVGDCGVAPVGLMLAAPSGSDSRILACAEAIEPLIRSVR
jgi:aspartyl-tRNA(Asn)/glutamyl-tRNA(Gln) amidotransferase subunit A